MAIIIGSVVGPQTLQDGATADVRADRSGATMVADAHARFQEAAYRSQLFSAGMTVTSISNVTFTTGTLGATGTPIIGLWNPVGSGKNCVVLQARMQIIVTTLGARTGPGVFMWCTAVAQSAISTGIVPLNRFSLAASGSAAKGFAGTALTGLSGNLTVQEAAGLQGGPHNVSGTDVLGVMPYASASIDPVDGGFVLQPGGVLALLCTTTPVGISAASSILWEEISV